MTLWQKPENLSEQLDFCFAVESLWAQHVVNPHPHVLLLSHHTAPEFMQKHIYLDSRTQTLVASAFINHTVVSLFQHKGAAGNLPWSWLWSPYTIWPAVGGSHLRHIYLCTTAAADNHSVHIWDPKKWYPHMVALVEINIPIKGRNKLQWQPRQLLRKLTNVSEWFSSYETKGSNID